jgi:hypothetical protein
VLSLVFFYEFTDRIRADPLEIKGIQLNTIIFAKKEYIVFTRMCFNKKKKNQSQHVGEFLNSIQPTILSTCWPNNRWPNKVQLLPESPAARSPGPGGPLVEAHGTPHTAHASDRVTDSFGPFLLTVFNPGHEKPNSRNRTELPDNRTEFSEPIGFGS